MGEEEASEHGGNGAVPGKNRGEREAPSGLEEEAETSAHGSSPRTLLGCEVTVSGTWIAFIKPQLDAEDTFYYHEIQL